MKHLVKLGLSVEWFTTFLLNIGERCLLLKNSTAIVVSNDFFLPKNTRSSVHEFIRRDLEFASQNLPASGTPGRVTKWSALTLLAKLHLTIASDLSNPKSAENFDLAKQFSQEVITQSGLNLMPNYADIFKYENNNNEESLFALQWMEGAYALGNSRQANWARKQPHYWKHRSLGGGQRDDLRFPSAGRRRR